MDEGIVWPRSIIDDYCKLFGNESEVSSFMVMQAVIQAHADALRAIADQIHDGNRTIELVKVSGVTVVQFSERSLSPAQQQMLTLFHERSALLDKMMQHIKSEVATVGSVPEDTFQGSPDYAHDPSQTMGIRTSYDHT